MLQNYENHLQNIIDEYKAYLSDYDTIYKNLFEKIEKNYDDLDELDQQYKQLLNILKSIQDSFANIKRFDPTVQIEIPKDELDSKNELIKKKLDEYKKIYIHFQNEIDRYKKYSQIVFDTLDNEQKEIDKLLICYSLKDIQNKQDLINQYNSAKKSDNQNNVNQIDAIWDEINHISNQTKIEIPNDLLNINEIKQKQVFLNQTFDDQLSNLENDEKKSLIY